jgi:hypothetical protein
MIQERPEASKEKNQQPAPRQEEHRGIPPIPELESRAGEAILKMEALLSATANWFEQKSLDARLQTAEEVARFLQDVGIKVTDSCDLTRFIGGEEARWKKILEESTSETVRKRAGGKLAVFQHARHFVADTMAHREPFTKVSAENHGESQEAHSATIELSKDGENARWESYEVTIGDRVKSDTGIGAAGVVYEASVKIKDKELPFVIKEFKYDGDAEIELRNYKIAKAAGLKTWDTYRISKDKKRILMSSGNAKGWEMIKSAFNEKMPQNKVDRLFPIKNFDSFLEECHEQARIAARQRIRIAGDVPLFRMRAGELDFVMGDMGNLEVVPEDEFRKLGEAGLLKENLQTLHSVLVVLFENNFGDFIEDETDPDGGHYVFNGGQEGYLRNSANRINENFGFTPSRYK